MDKDVKAIIERLEAASGPDRELDALIECIIAPSLSDFVAPEGVGYSFEADGEAVIWYARTSDSEPWKVKKYAPSNYTSSIDAALSLIPADVVGYEIICFENGSGFQCCVGDEMADAKTAALGICIAALRARAHKGDG